MATEVPAQLSRSNAAFAEGCSPAIGDGDYCNQEAAAAASNDDEYYGTVFVQCVNMWRKSPVMRQLIFDPQLAEAVATITKLERLRLYHDHVLIKPPWGSPTNFHTDNQLDPFFTADSAMLWIALDDCTVANGALHFLPGTHREARWDKSEMHDGFNVPTIGGLFKQRPEWATRDPEVVEVKAGDAILINGMVVHGAGPNMTPRPRRAAALLFVPADGLEFNGQPGALHSELINSTGLVQGELVDTHLPLLWPQ